MFWFLLKRSRHDKAAMRTPASKMLNSRSLKRTGCQYVGYFYYSENLNCATRNPRLGRPQVGHSWYRPTESIQIISAMITTVWFCYLLPKGDAIGKLKASGTTRLVRNKFCVEQGFPTWGTCTPGMHLPIRRGTFKVSNRR